MRLKTTSKSLPRSESSCTVRSKQRRIIIGHRSRHLPLKYTFLILTCIRGWQQRQEVNYLEFLERVVVHPICGRSNVPPTSWLNRSATLIFLRTHTQPPICSLSPSRFCLRKATHLLRDVATGFRTLLGGKLCELRYLRLYVVRTWLAILGPLICFESHVSFYDTSGARTFTAVASFVSG